MKPTTAFLAVLVSASLFAPAATCRPRTSPIEQGRLSVSLGGGFQKDSFYMAGGLGYFVLDGLMPGVRYLYARQSEDDFKLSQHNVNAYVRYYLTLTEELFPFLVGDVGWLRHAQFGDGVEDDAGSLYSVMGGGGLAYFLSAGFYVEIVLGLRHYLNPPPWASELKTTPTQPEWAFGFGASF